MYGPYVRRNELWDQILHVQCLQDRNLVVEGDLKFTLNWKEIWSLHARVGVLGDYFRNYKEIIYLVGVEPIELKPTWVKNWARMDNIYKYMDWCMIHQ